MKGEEFIEMTPWYSNFRGQITKLTNDSYQVQGIAKPDFENDQLHILELPIRTWTRNYKTFLEKKMEDRKTDLIDLVEYHTQNHVHFQVNFAEGKLKQFCDQNDIYKYFRLKSKILLRNLVLFDRNNKLKKYSTPLEILEDFYELRIMYYSKRKQYLKSVILRDLQILKNKERFINSVIEGELVLRNKKKSHLIQELISLGYSKMKNIIKIKSTILESQEQAT